MTHAYSCDANCTDSYTCLYHDMCLLCAIHFHGVAKNINFYNLHITFLQEDQKNYSQLLSCGKTWG